MGGVVESSESVYGATEGTYDTALVTQRSWDATWDGIATAKRNNTTHDMFSE